MINPALTVELLRHSVRAWNAAQVDGYTADLYRADLHGANIRGANIRGANLRGAYLRGAYLSEAYLSGANLSGADLSGANLSEADLRGANLSEASLSGANLSEADLSGANLSEANIRWADIRGADIRGADWGVSIPTVPRLDAAILDAIGEDPTRLNMRNWHTCETTHCRAGWAVTLAGDAGRALEAKTSPYLAGRLIYEASRPGVPCPDFFASDDDALADITRCASV